MQFGQMTECMARAQQPLPVGPWHGCCLSCRTTEWSLLEYYAGGDQLQKI